MREILRKELRLSASVLSWLFIAFALLFFVPGYPILCGVFFVTLGIFQSFRNAREANDTVFSVLLPIAKADFVRGRYLFVCLIELCAFLLMGVITALRMTAFAGASVYRANALMNANSFALGMALVIFGLFNAVFVGGFFKTGYHFTKPFLRYIILAFLMIIIAEAAHYLPGLAWLNAFGTEYAAKQLAALAAGAAVFTVLTCFSCRGACRRFENIDL